ncbi:unnamed protein product [Lampetra fluviatilis]
MVSPGTMATLRTVLLAVASVCTILSFLSGLYGPRTAPVSRVSQQLARKYVKSYFSICLKIKQKGSTLGLSMFPFVSLCVSCTLWLRYGLLLGDPTIVYVNAVGASIGVLYSIIFYVNTPHKRSLYRTMVGPALLLYAVLLYVKYLAEDEDAARPHLGMVCTLWTVVNYGSPLATLAEVVRSRSTESLAFPLCAANLVVGTEWFIYGLMLQDMFIQVPNLLGALLGLGQLSLFLVYPSSSKAPTSSTKVPPGVYV